MYFTRRKILFQKVDIRGRNFDHDLLVDVITDDFVKSLRREIGDRPIKPKKADDIKKLLPFIPRVHRDFYERIIRNVWDQEEEGDD